MTYETSFLNTLLALAASFLGLAVVVQIAQELWKFLTSSKSKAYAQVLEDFLEPLKIPIAWPDLLKDSAVRGPLQFRKAGQRNKLLPLDKNQLLRHLEQAAPSWIQRGLEELTSEADLQHGQPRPPSTKLMKFLREIGDADKVSVGFQHASNIATFLGEWEHDWKKPGDDTKVGFISPPKILDANHLLTAFRKEFLRDVDLVGDRFSHLEKDFEYTYRRRNMRQSFTIALLIAVVCNLPFHRLYRMSSQLSPDEAVKLAEKTSEIYDKHIEEWDEADTTADARIRDAEALAHAYLADAASTVAPGSVNYIIDWTYVRNLWSDGLYAILRQLFGCLVTALLVSFGAPFWNDLLSLLLSAQKGRKKSPAVDESQ